MHSFLFYIKQPSYWRGPKQVKSIEAELHQKKQLETFEKENNEAITTVDIQNISKVFKIIEY